MNLNVVDITRKLVNYRSPSLESNVPVSEYVADLLRKLGFDVEAISYRDANEVEKLCVVGKLGDGVGGLSLFSHNDTVPAAKEDGWGGDPYKARVSDGKLYGRGAADMKGPLAASICAAARFRPRDLKSPLYVIATADEEFSGVGARHVTEKSRLFDEASTGYGLVCEPTRLRVVHAHKGSLHIRVTSRGKSAHTSTLKGVNANMKMIPFLSAMKELNERVLSAKRFRNDEFKPPHSELSLSINDHLKAMNVYPVVSECRMSYRIMPGVDVDGLVKRVRECAREHGLKFELLSRHPPLYTSPDSQLVKTALKLSGTRAPTTVAYGTDGIRYVKKMKRLVVLGPGNIAQGHTVDEWIELEQLRKGVDLYSRFIDHVCVNELR